MQEYGDVGQIFGWLEVAFLGSSIVLCIIVFLLWVITAARGRGARGGCTYSQHRCLSSLGEACASCWKWCQA